MSQIFRQTL